MSIMGNGYNEMVKVEQERQLIRDVKIVLGEIRSLRTEVKDLKKELRTTRSELRNIGKLRPLKEISEDDSAESESAENQPVVEK